jgi:predicted glycosyltransferase
MKRILIYSHDTFGLGNIRRMLAISRGLLDSVPGLSILLITGSPVIHSLRLPEEMDYIKLPCLTRTGRGEYGSKYLSSSVDELIRMRSEMILTATRHFSPDLLMVDKKPLGVKGELEPTLRFLKTERPETRTVLILRDVLDRPATIIDNWRRNGHAEAIRTGYDRVLVLGQAEIFDPVSEYELPATIAARVRFCGYLRKTVTPEQIRQVRHSLGLDDGEQGQLLLVTPGGGEDGYEVIEKTLEALERMARPVERLALRTVIVSGPEMAREKREVLRRRAGALPEVRFLDFSNDLLGLMGAADLVISMGGYNTICEILSLRKRAIVVPRVRPTEEQLIRAERMAPFGLFTVIHPDRLTGEELEMAIDRQLKTRIDESSWAVIDLEAQRVINEEVAALLDHEK